MRPKMSHGLPAPRRSARFWSVAKTALALALIGFILSRTNLSDLTNLHHRISFTWLAASVALFALLNGARAHQYFLLIGGKARFSRVLSLTIYQNTMSNFVASSAGALLYMTMLSAGEGVKFRAAAASFVIAKMGDLIAVGALLAVSAAFVWDQIEPLRELVALLVAGVIGLAIAAALLLFFRQAFVGQVDRILDRVGAKRSKLVLRMLEILRSLAADDLRAARGTLAVGLGYSALVMLINVAWLYANFRAFSVDAPIAAVSLMNAMLQLLSWIPIQVFGGLGVVEAALLYFAAMFGIQESTMAPVSIGIRALLYLSSLLLLSYPFLSGLAPGRPKSR
jgi:uncharacterized protein (TIRG00374 family)